MNATATTNATTKGVIVTSANADEIFDVVVGKARPGSPDFMNLSFARRGAARDEFGGGGIYAVHHRGRLLYVGKYTGHAKRAFAGDVVRERLSKHLEALTMRGRRVSLRANNYDLAIALPASPLVDAVRRHVALRDGNGGVRTYPDKVAFAAERWDAMSALGTDGGRLGSFGFVYGRLDPSGPNGDMSHRDLYRYLEAIEDGLIERLDPRCNVRRSKVNEAHLALGPAPAAWDDLGRRIEETATRHRDHAGSTCDVVSACANDERRCPSS